LLHRPGIVYTTTPEGLELPVIDLTNPSFAIADDPVSRAALTEQYKLTEDKNARGPVFLRRIFIKLGARQSQLLRALSQPAGSFLGGLTTYIMKLGPDNLPDGFTSSLDLRVAGSPHARFVRLRLQHCATMLATGLEPLLAASPNAPLHFINIGGGPAMDSLNALLFLSRRNATLLNRPIAIHVCDLDTNGPSFGASAVRALQAPGAPLEKLEITFDQRAYDWNNISVLEDLLTSIESNAIVGASSEGALFEYGSDEAIVANLRALRSGVKLVVGSVTSNLPIRREQIKTMRFDLHPRGVEGFRPLTQQAGYTIECAEVTPLSDHLLLRPN